MRFQKSILFAAVALIAPLAMHADPITSTSSLTLGSLDFSNFTCSIVATKGGADTTPNNCSGIMVGTITSPANGLQFSSAFFATDGKSEDALLGYTVTSTGSGITNVGLSFSPTFLGYAVDSVTETIYSNNTTVASLTVICDSNSNPCGSSENIALSGSYTNLQVIKDIQLNSDTGSTQFSWVDQTFTTGPGGLVASTPEPGSMALLGAGLFAIGAIRRRMVKA